MRRRTYVLVAWLAGCAVLGCNLILGSEAAVFEPDGGGPGAGEAGNDGTLASDSPIAEGGGADSSDGSAPDANPCVDTDTNPLHCGACGHNCLGGACIAAKCQPVEVTAVPGNAKAITVDANYIYFTNEAAGDVLRVPIAGGAVQTIYDGPAGTVLGKALVKYLAQIYFTVSEADGGVYRCPITGCGDAGPEAVVTPLVEPDFIALSGLNKLLVVESTGGGRVGRCTLPCGAAGLDDIVSPSEGFPLYAVDQGDNVYWSTLFPAGGAVRARPAGQAVKTIKATAVATEIAIAGADVVYVELGIGPVAVPRDGGAKRRLSTTSYQAERLVIDKNTVFFNDANSTGGRILSCGVAGCGDGGVTLATKQLNPYAIAVDNKSIYWTNQGDSDAGAAIMRVAR